MIYSVHSAPVLGRPSLGNETSIFTSVLCSSLMVLYLISSCSLHLSSPLHQAGNPRVRHWRKRWKPERRTIARRPLPRRPASSDRGSSQPLGVSEYGPGRGLSNRPCLVLVLVLVLVLFPSLLLKIESRHLVTYLLRQGPCQMKGGRCLCPLLVVREGSAEGRGAGARLPWPRCRRASSGRPTRTK